MNVDRSIKGMSVIRLLAASLVLVALGWIALNLGSRSRIAKVAPLQFSPVSPLAVSGNLPVLKPDELSRAHSIFAGLPLVFEPNEGQAGLNPADSRAFFMARGSGYALLLGSEGATLNLVSRASLKPTSARNASGPISVESLQMKFAGANPHPAITASDRLSGVTNYFLGNSPSHWRPAVPQFARVRYESIYPGINLVFYGNQGHLEYDFQVAPGAEPDRAELEFDGAKKLELSHGGLVIRGENGSLRLAAPSVYQEIEGRRHVIAGNFVLRGNNRAGFAIGDYDRSRELVIDPVLSFSTYFGGSGDELNNFVAIDGSGNVYLAGSTTSPNLPVSGGVVQTTLNGSQNVFIAKITPPAISPTQTASLVYVTYLGGNGSDTPVGIGVDAAGDTFVAGTTTSTNFPTTPSAYQTVPEAGSGGTQHVFVTELVGPNTSNPTQALFYSTYLSGSGNDVASGMTTDSQGFVYVTGTTTSLKPSDYAATSQFPVTNIPNTLPYQNIPRSAFIQFFVTKVYTQAAHQGSIYYSTYFGGGSSATTTPIAVGGDIAVDPTGNIYFTGTTNFIFTATSPTSDFPILNAYQPCLDTPPPAVYVNPPAPCPNTSSTVNTDAFVAKLNPNPSTVTSQASQLQWSTYLGGSGNDSGTGIGLDSGAVNVYVTGTTDSPGLGVSATVTNAGTYQRCLDSPTTPSGTACPTIAAPVPTDAFVGRLTNPAFSTTLTNVALNYFSYLGGSGNDAGLALTVDTGNGAVVTGWTQSTDFPIFPTPNDGIQSSLNGPQDAFIARLYTNVITGQNTTSSWATYFGGSGTDQGDGVALDSNGAVYVSGQTNSPDLLVEKPLPANEGGSYNGGYDAFVTQLTSAASLSVTGTLLLGPNQTYISAGNQATFTYIVTNNGPDLANTVIINDDLRPLTTVIPMTFNSATASSGICGGGSTGQSVSCNIPTLQAGSTAIITIILTPTSTATGNSATFNGGTVTATAVNNVTPAQTSVSALMSDFTLSVVPANVTVPQAGDTASYQVQLTPHPVYGTPIALSVTGLPTATNSVFTATPITLQGTSPGSTILNIGTTTRPINTLSSLFTRHFYAIWLPIPGMVLLGLGSGGRRRRRILGGMTLYLLFALIVFLPSCSGQIVQPPATGTPAGTYTLTVTATSGTDSKSQNIVLTVP